MAKKKNQGVSFLPEDTVEGTGLPDGFNGEITRCRLVPWTYPNGSLDHYILALAIDIEPDEDSGFAAFTDHHSAGSLALFVPSDDGSAPAGGDLEDYEALASGEGELGEGDEELMAGRYALQVGAKPQLIKSKATKSAESAIAAGAEAAADGDWSCFEGVYARFDRIPYELPGGKMSEILVPTQVMEADSPAKSSKAKPKKRKAKAAPVEDADEDDGDDATAHDDAIDAVITHALGLKKFSDGLPIAKLQSVIFPKFKGVAKKEALARATDEDFLGDEERDREWYFDADDGMVYATEE